MAVVEREVVAEVPRPAQISWGAVFAGTFVVAGVSWLLFLLGSAIGVGIADASDMEAIGDGLGIGAIIWILISSLLAYFIGSVLAGRLAGSPNETVGMLHGVTLWGFGTTLMLLMSYYGISGLVQTGQSLIKATAGAGAAVVSSAAVGAAGAAGAVNAADVNMQSLLNSPLMTDIQAQIKRQASEVIAKADEQTAGGAEVSEAEIRRALRQIDQRTLRDVAMQLLGGNVASAKNALVVNTDLSEEEINAIVDGISNAVEQQVEAAQEELGKTAETVSDYTQAVLWAAFIASALGLAVCIFGGMVGSQTVSRLYVFERRTSVT